MGRHSRTIKDGAFCVDTAKNNDLYCCGKLMDISTGNWFEYLREEVLTDGLRDIGLPERSVDFIENAMANAVGVGCVRGARAHLPFALRGAPAESFVVALGSAPNSTSRTRLLFTCT